MQLEVIKKQGSRKHKLKPFGVYHIKWLVFGQNGTQLMLPDFP